MASIHPYLTFQGTCEAAFLFYKSVFGGEFTFMGRFSEMPPMGDKPLSAEDANLIMHVSMPIGGGTNLFGSDTSETLGYTLTEGNNFSISINAETREEADRLFNGLSEGGKITLPLNDTFWGAYFGMFTDKFGVQWMVNYDQPKD